MSSFSCEQCGTDILENESGNYITECEHYPLIYKPIDNSHPPEHCPGCGARTGGGMCLICRDLNY
jgi:hypothetical protein